MQPYSSTKAATAWKNSRIILLEMKLLYGLYPINGRLRLSFTYDDTAFSRWDTATEVN